MAKKIKFSFIKFLYACFSFLADKTGGWKIFVQPKLFLGTALIGILGIGVNSYAQEQSKCYKVAMQPLDTVVVDNDTICTRPDTKPQFVGGEKALMKWLNDNINYAPHAMCYVSIQGKVFVKFVVEKDGLITNIKVIKAVHPSLDNEAVRLVKSMPNWIPAQHDGKIVSSYFTLPVTFILK